MRKNRLILTLLAIWAIVTIWTSGYIVGQSGKNVVCHAETEDSVITDCDYQNGQWVQK